MVPLSGMTLTWSCFFLPLLHISASGIGHFSYQPALLLLAVCWSGLELRWDLFTLSLTSVDLICLSCCIYKRAVTVLSNLSGTEEKVVSVHLVIHKSGFSACSGVPGFQFRRIWLNRSLFISFILVIQCNHNCYWEEQWHINHSSTDNVTKVISSHMLFNCEILFKSFILIMQACNTNSEVIITEKQTLSNVNLIVCYCILSRTMLIFI